MAEMKWSLKKQQRCGDVWRRSDGIESEEEEMEWSLKKKRWNGVWTEKKRRNEAYWEEQKEEIDWSLKNKDLEEER